MRTTGHLDWLEYTIPLDIPRSLWLPSELLPNELSVKEGRTAHYNSIFTNEIGIIVLTNGEQRQGTHIQYKGEPLETIRAMGLTEKSLIAHLMQTDGKISRLDVAVNIHEGQTIAADLEREYVEGLCITKARGAERHYKLQTDEDTLYIGSPQSDRRFRAYNKGAQLHTGEAWLRLELQLRKLRAKAVSEAIIKAENPRTVYNRAIKDYVDFPTISEYQMALIDHDATIDKVPRKIHKTYAWLMNVCAPVLARYVFEHPDADALSAFIALYNVHFRALQSPPEGE